MRETKELVSAADAAVHFGVAQRTIQRWVKVSDITGYWTGKKLRVDLAEIQAKKIKITPAAGTR